MTPPTTAALVLLLHLAATLPATALRQAGSQTACTPDGLGLPSDKARDHMFLPTTCSYQEALGISQAMCSRHHRHGGLTELEALAHNVSAELHHHNGSAAIGAVEEALRSRLERPPLTCRPSPGPYFTYDFLRNGSSPGEYIVIPPPPHGDGAAGRRRLAAEEAADIAEATPFDSVVTTGAVVTYYPAANGSIDANAFQNAFYNAYATLSVNVFRVATGNWTIITTYAGFHLLAGCNSAVRSAFTLDFGGSTFIFSDGTAGGVFMSYCNNITVTNGTFYYPLSQNPWYQATITAQSANKLQWTIQVQDGYPTSYVTNPNYAVLCVAWDPVTRLPRQNCSDIYPSQGQTTLLSGRSYQMNFGYLVDNVNVGDYITCRGNQGNHGFIPWYNQYSTFQYITIYNAAVFGFYEETGRGNTYIGNVIEPMPAALAVGIDGPQQAPLQSSTADGFHSSGSFQGPTLINNYFTNMGDDGIAIHGHYYLVVAVDPVGSNITVALLCGYDCSRLYPGNSLLATANTTQPLGAVTILANNLVPNPLPANAASYTFPSANLAASYYANITVNCWPASFSALVYDSVVTSTSNEGDGAVVQNNIVSYNRGRGILLKASNVLVEGNTFTEPKFFAAQITPEYFFQEAYFTSNLVLQNNVLNSYFGGILVGFIFDSSGLPSTFQNHLNILIHNNTIMNAADQPLLITSSNGVTVSNNAFNSVLCYPYTVGAPYSFIPSVQPPIYLATSSNLVFSGNSYNIPANCTYGNFTQPIQTYGNTVTNLTITS